MSSPITLRQGIGLILFVVVVTSLALQLIPRYKTWGTKEENDIQLAYGVITQFSTIHGYDIFVRIENCLYVFEFRHYDISKPNLLGRTIFFVYEWQLLFHADEFPNYKGNIKNYNEHYYWAPVVLQYELER